MAKQRVPEIHIDKKIQNKNINTNTASLKILRLAGINISRNIAIFILICELLVSGIIGSFIYKPLTFILPAMAIILEYLYLNRRKQKRIINVYDQMDKFMKRCSNEIYDDLALFFGLIYTEFNGNLSKDLEDCYIEATQTKNSKKALDNFKSKYESGYLNFCLDTLQIIKQKETKVSSDYLIKQTKSKVALVKEAYKTQLACKTDIVMSVVLAGILIILLNVLFGFKMSLFITPIGIVMSITLGILFVIGMFSNNKE